MSSFGNQGAGFYAGTNWGNPYGGRYYGTTGQATGSTGLKTSSPLDAVANLIYSGQNLGDTLGGSGSDGGGPVGNGNTSSGRSGGLGGIGGLGASMASSYAMGQMGVPGYIGGPISSAIGKAVAQGELTQHDIATIGLTSLTKGALPGLFAGPLGLAAGIGFGLMGYNPFSALVDQLAWASSTPEAMSNAARAAYVGNWLGLDLNETPFENTNPFSQDIGSTTPGFDDGDLGGGISTSARGEGISIGGMSGNRGTVGLDVSGAFPGLSVSAPGFSSEDVGGGPAFGGLGLDSMGPLGDAPSAGSWGGGTTEGGGYDGSGQGADGNTGNAGEG